MLSAAATNARAIAVVARHRLSALTWVSLAQCQIRRDSGARHEVNQMVESRSYG
jgi:hypothetical protein